MAGEISHRDFAVDVVLDVREAIRANDVEALQHLVDTQLRIFNRRNTLILYFPIERGSVQMTKILLDAGLDRDYCEGSDDDRKSNFSPLHAALTVNNREIKQEMVKLLLEAGVDPQKEQLYEETCLHRAVRVGDSEMVRFLWNAGIDVNCSNKSEFGKGHTPLHAAVGLLSGEPRIEMVKLLIDLGADVNTKGSTRDVWIRDGVVASCLHLVSEQILGACEVLQLMLNAGARLNNIDSQGFTPLGLAAYRGDNCELMRQMIAAGADLELSGEFLLSPLNVAVEESNKDAVQLLLENGANPNAMIDGISVLMTAAQCLLKVHDATQTTEYEILKMLLAHGANPHCTTDERGIPFRWVLASGTIEAMHLFFEYGVTLDNCGLSYLFHHAAQNNKKDILEYLLNRCCHQIDEIYLKDESSIYRTRNSTPLFGAIDAQRKNNVQLLIEWGADVNIPRVAHGENDADAVVTTPLFQALKHCNCEIVDLLLSAGANMNVKGVRNDEWQRVLDKVSDPQNRKVLTSVVGEITLVKGRECFDPNEENVLIERFGNISSDLENQCSTELDALRSVILYGSITYYDLLRGKDVTRCMGNVRVIESFEANAIVQRFPIYGNRLRNCFTLAKIRREIVNEVMDSLNYALHHLFDHYRNILDTIISHFRLKDLRILRSHI